jgi:hypothetical protein
MHGGAVSAVTSNLPGPGAVTATGIDAAVSAEPGQAASDAAAAVATAVAGQESQFGLAIVNAIAQRTGDMIQAIADLLGCLL